MISGPVGTSDDITSKSGFFASLFECNRELKRLKPVWFHEDLILLLNLLKQGKIKPIVAARMPLDQAAQAHKLLASGSVKGKIVLICND
jgi:NADPH:quinone reductase-like Zn-dependent oxidoreductase